MRNRGPWIALLVIGILAIVGWRVLRRTTAPVAASSDVAGARSTRSVGSASLVPRSRALETAEGSSGSARPVAGFDCARPTGDAARVDGAALSLAGLCTRLDKIGAITAAGVDRQQARFVVDRMVDATLVKRALELRRAAVSDAEVAAKLASVQAAQGSAAIDAAWLAEQLRERLELQKLQSLDTRIEVTEQEVDAELAIGAPGIDRGQGVRIEAWIARIPPGADAAVQAATRQVADDFARAVKTTSPEAAAAHHPLKPIPPFVVSETGVEPELEDAARSLAKGQWSGAVRTRVGWTVLRVLDSVAGQPLDDKALRGRVRQALENRTQQTSRQRVLEALRAAATIEILVAF